MKKNRTYNTCLSIMIALIFICLGFFSIFSVQSETGNESNDSSIMGFTSNNHVTPEIWIYSQTLNKPSKAVVLTLGQNQWEALTAICAVPAFLGRTHSIPLMFSDGSDKISTVIPYDTKAITLFGTDGITACAKLAKEYWAKAELVFAVSDYEQALWIVPSASFLGAPILVSPTQETLNALGTKCAILIGDTSAQVNHVVKLTTKEDVWSFQLELFDTKGVLCNYAIVTNPLDTDDSKPSDIKWRYQSPAAALLAAYRYGIVQTGDWSVNRTAFEAVEKAGVPDETNYNKIKAGFTKLKEDSYAVEKFLQDNGHTPEYLAAVGGPYAVPNFVYDIHVDYYWPTSNPQKTQYPSSLAAYATLKETVDATKYVKEDLAAGRLAAGNIFDLTKQLMRTFFYREFLPNGDYYSSMPNDWEKKACFADGHRLNQPEPDSLDWDPTVPYYPYEGVNPAFETAGLTVGYYLPRNESDPYDLNSTIEKIMEKTTDYGYFHFMPHGGLTNLRIEVGIDNVTGRQNKFLEASTIYDLNYKAPTLIYTSCCKGGFWMLDKKADGEYEPSDFTPSSFIHAGAVAYIATPEIQSACFWKEAPYSVAGDQAINFWENLFSGNVPIGKAWRDAKWTAHQTWESKTPKPESTLTHHADCISYTLWGDPALEISKPNKPFSTTKMMDVDLTISEITPEEEFTVNVTLKDLATGNELSGSSVKITFQGTEETDTTGTFTAPKYSGEYTISVEVTKDGYSVINAKSWLQVGEVTPSDGDGDNGDDKKKDDDKGFLPGFDSIIIISLLIVVIINIKWLSRNRN